MPESEAHVKIKKIIYGKFNEWYGASIREFYDEGHKLDVYAVTSEGYSIYAEVIWDPSKSHFKDDLLSIERSDADIIITIVNPEILENAARVREFEKTLVSKRKAGTKMSPMLNGHKILDNPGSVNHEIKQIVDVLLSEKREQRARDQQKKIEIFRVSKEVLLKSSHLLKGHLGYLEEKGNEYHAKSRIPGEIENIIKHSSVLSSIGNRTEKEKIKSILEKGAIYGGLTTTQQFLKFSNEIREWANEANSIQIDLS